MPALQVLQDKYKDKLVVVLSHVVPFNKKAVLGNLKKTKIKAACYQDLKLKKAPLTEDGIPLIVLIDHNGKVLAQNWELEGMEKKIAEAVKAVTKK